MNAFDPMMEMMMVAVLLALYLLACKDVLGPYPGILVLVAFSILMSPPCSNFVGSSCILVWFGRMNPP